MTKKHNNKNNVLSFHARGTRHPHCCSRGDVRRGDDHRGHALSDRIATLSRQPGLAHFSPLVQPSSVVQAAATSGAQQRHQTCRDRAVATSTQTRFIMGAQEGQGRASLFKNKKTSGHDGRNAPWCNFSHHFNCVISTLCGQNDHYKKSAQQ